MVQDARHIRGSLHLEWRRCGKMGCRCARGSLHGPYFVRRWRDGGKQKKALVSPEEVPGVLASIEARRALTPASVGALPFPSVLMPAPRCRIAELCRTWPRAASALRSDPRQPGGPITVRRTA